MARYKNTTYTIKKETQGKRSFWLAHIENELVRREFTSYTSAQKLVHSIIDRRQKQS